MGKCGVFFLVLIAVLAFVGFKVKNALFSDPEVPKLENTWWGPGDPSKEDKSIKPFKINVPEDIIKDLNHRLEIAKPFIPPLENSYQHYGMNTQLLSNIITYWKTKYNWRAREKFLNQYPQFTVSVQGLRIHYLHIKPAKTEGKKVLPLLLLHGWPGSIREFYEIIPILSKPQENYVFELIIPSLPGYGFSEGAVRPGLGAAEVAVLFNNFMKRIGFNKYYIQGGDWGGIIVQHLATLYPKNIIGAHSNMCSGNPALSTLVKIVGSYFPSLVASEEEIPKIFPFSEKFFGIILETGYMHLQATKPDTIGAALRETPVGMAAYILEKFTTWTNPAYKNRLDGGLKEKYTYDKLLDNLMIYWVTDSITTSVRLYAETFRPEEFALGLANLPVKVPSGCARFTHELAHDPHMVLKLKYHNLLHLSDLDGGHFAAFETPKVLATDVIEFVNKVEKLGKNTKKSEL